MARDPVVELGDLADNAVDPYVRAIERLAEASIDGRGLERARSAVQRVIGQTMTLADLLGRRRLLLEARAAEARGEWDGPTLLFDDPTATRLPAVPFLEAIRDLLSREPVLARSAAAVSRVYQTTVAFAMARSVELTVTRKVRDVLARFLEAGAPLPKAEKVIAQMGGFTEAYAETVYRTNLSTAYSRGRHEQAQDPDVAAVIPAFECRTAGDSDVRLNHRPAHGFVAATSDPVWQRLTPPFGYNCRCGIRSVDRFELRRRGLLEGSRVLRFEPPGFAAFAPDQGFEKFLVPRLAV